MASQYIVHTVGVGDTIQAIAMMYGCDWTELVTINGLEYPYIDDVIGVSEYADNDAVAKVGSKLVIPTTGINIPQKTNNSSAEVEKYAFGCDLDLYSWDNGETASNNLETEGELSSDGKGDVLLSEGLNNLRQQLTTRLGTPKGALLLHPEFGTNLLDYIGRRTTVELLTKIQLEIRECLLSDFRVKDVGDINVAFHDHAIFVDCIIYPIEPYSVFRLSQQFTK